MKQACFGHFFPEFAEAKGPSDRLKGIPWIETGLSGFKMEKSGGKWLKVEHFCLSLFGESMATTTSHDLFHLRIRGKT